jgi:hypothetical protein
VFSTATDSSISSVVISHEDTCNNINSRLLNVVITPTPGTVGISNQDTIFSVNNTLKTEQKQEQPSEQTQQVQEQQHNKSAISLSQQGGAVQQHPTIPEAAVSMNQTYSYDRLQVASQNFSRDCLISDEGAFGPVYRAQLTPSFIVAVKVMTDESSTNAHNLQQFHNEIQILQTCRHPHLLQLLGYCTDGPRPCLVYEYKSRGSLRGVLTSTPESLDFRRRLECLRQVASALEFLHTVTEPLIIHRDVKTANILVDESWNCALGDFGIARLSPESNARVGVGASTRIFGTPGYIDPEYARLGELSDGVAHLVDYVLVLCVCYIMTTVLL